MREREESLKTPRVVKNDGGGEEGRLTDGVGRGGWGGYKARELGLGGGRGDEERRAQVGWAGGGGVR